MTLGSNIQKIRKEAQMSQEEFAEMFDVTRQTISNWENSKSYPDLETLVKISDRFAISLDILLKEDMVMVKTFDKEVKNTRKYAKALVAIAAVFVLLIGSFAIYSLVYFNAKNSFEASFEEKLKDNNFYKNRDGYYSMDYGNGIVYGVPKQSIPGLLEFSLDFGVEDIYCTIDREDIRVEITWENDKMYAATISKDNNLVTGSIPIYQEDEIVIGSTATFEESDFKDMKKLGEELGLSEKEISEIVEKGKELYKEFYAE